MSNENITYREALKLEMKELTADPKTIHIGYNCAFGPKMNGTLVDIPKERIIETPLDECTMAGMAIGMALTGEYHPVVHFERFNFIFNASDQIVHQLSVLPKLSQGEYKPKVLIRVTCGNENTGFYPGVQHVGDFSDAFESMLSFPVYRLKSVADIKKYYALARESDQPAMLVDYRDLYDTTE